MSKNINYEELSKEELIKLLLKSNEEKKELSKEIAKKNKDFAKSDEIRQTLLSKNLF